MYEEYFKRIEEECFIRNRTKSTTDFYKFHVGNFLKWTENKQVDELTLLDARNYILCYANKERRPLLVMV